MPTSSQALILHKEAGTRSETVLRTQSILIKEPVPFAIASIYYVSGRFPLSKQTIDDEDAVKLLGKESAQIFKYHQLPLGYTSIIAYDSSRETFNWQVLGGVGAKRSDTVLDVIKVPTGDTNTAEPIKRPASEIDVARYGGKRQTRAVDEFMYEKLVGLGFRKSDFTIVDESGKEIKELKPITDKKVVKVPGMGVERFDMSQRTPDNSPRESIDISPRVKDVKKVEVEEKETDPEPFYDVISDDSDYDYNDEYNRIKPSIYMVKQAPKRRPTAAILSLRENECSFHGEVKFFIETQIGVRVKSIQYDPLHIRSGKPDLRSRWIVDFNTVSDVEKVVKKGLTIGKDKIIIYKFDDIMKRELSTFQYFRAVLDAKKRLKGCKSTVSNKIKGSSDKSQTVLRSSKSKQ